MRNFERLLILSDTHVPYQDQNCIKLSIKVIKAFKPDTVIHIGDLLDFYGFSRFDNKDPRKMGRLQQELDEGHSLLKEWRKHFNGDFFLLRGNHEYRLTKYINNNAPELHELPSLKLQSLLKLDEIGVKYVESGRMDFNGLLVKHGDLVRNKSGYTAFGEMEKSGISGISGHTHRLGQIYRTNRGGMYNWTESGCLCTLDPDYLEGATPDWQQGLSYGYFTKDRNKRFEVHTLPFINNKAVIEGKELSV